MLAQQTDNPIFAGGFLAALLDTLEHLVLVIDSAGRIVAFNRACEELSGYSFAEVQGRSCWDFLLLPEEAGRITAYFQRLLAGDAERTHMNHWLTRSGRRRPIAWSNLVMRDDVGQMQYVVGTGTDLTAQREAEAAARRSSRSYRTIVDTAQEGIWVVDAAERTTYVNQRMAQMLGYTVEEMLGRSIFDFMDDDARALTKRSIERKRQGAVLHEDTCLRRKDGAVLWTLLSASAVFGPDGEYNGSLAMLTDITERKKTEQALQQSNELFRTVLEHAPIGLSLENLEGRWVQVNRALCEITGYSEQELLGLGFQDITHPDDLEPDLRHLRQLLAGEIDRYEVEKRYLHKQGHTVWVLLSIGLVHDVGGQPLYIVAQVQDITRRKQVEQALRESERQYRALLEQASDAIFVTDAQGNFIEANDQASRLTGYTRDELLGSNASELIVADAAGLAALAQAPRQAMRAEVLIRRKDGTTIPVESVGGQLDDGRLLGIVRDISERKQAEQDRVQRQAAEAANAAKSEFLSRLSHELRTPLNAILGFAQIMQMSEIGPEQEESLSYILKGGRHLLELINEILDISRIEQGRMAFNVAAVPLDEVVQEALDLIHPLLAGRDLELRAPAIMPCSGEVLADRQRLRQVLVNLLSNAIKYNRAGGSIVVRCSAADRAHIRVTVSDTGTGIPAEKLSRLFTPFERLGAENSGIEGTGIGLALSQRLATAMGSKIEVSSTPGVGSSFWLDLPLVNAAALTVEATAEPASVTADPAGSAIRNVMYVEDDNANIALVERILRRWTNVELTAVRQGSVALELASRQPPDLLLLDMHLPDLDGLELLRRLHDSPLTSTIPVVFISADSSIHLPGRSLAAGARAYLSKPLDIPEFISAVGAILELPLP